MNDRIFSIGYRRLDATPRHTFPQWPIARTALVLAWRRRASKVALLFCLGVLVVHATWLVSQVLVGRFQPEEMAGAVAVEATFGQASEVLSRYIQSQFFVTAIALAVVAAGFVAEDRQAGALDLYFARPLSRTEYATGKILAVAAVPLVTLVLPALGLWFAAVGGTAGDRAVGLLRLGLPTLAGSACATLWLTGVLIGLSALGEKARTVGALFIGLLIGLAALGEALPAAGHDWGGYLAPARDLRTISDHLLAVGGESMGGQLLGAREPANANPWLSFLALAVQSGAGFLALAWRLRREVVG